MATTRTKKATATRKPKASAKGKAKSAAKAKQAEAAKAKRARAREAAREQKAKATQAERDAAIKSGDLILGKGDVEFHAVEKDGNRATLDERAEKILDALRKSKTPVMGRDLQEQFGGSWALYIPVFSTLKALGLLREYRRRTGERGGSGVAYLYTE